MTIGALLTVLRLLAGTAAAMGARDILLLLGFGLHLAIIFRLITSTSEVDAVLQYILKIVHLPFYFFTFLPFNGGTDEHR